MGASSVAARVFVVLGTFAGIVAADYGTGVDVALRALYVLPVGLATWFVHRAAGAAVAALAAGACIAFDVHAGLAGSHRWFVYSDAAARILTYLGVVYVLDRLRSAQQQLGDLARNDPLTGIANLRGFREQAQRELDRAQRLSTPFTLAHIDLDDFKAVNDASGHPEGDRVLMAVARVLSSGRALDIAARVGGDEFVLLMPETTRTSAEAAIGRVREQLALAMNEHAWPVTFSIGVATFLVAPESVERTLAVADALMYSVKRSSKNSVLLAEISESAPTITTLSTPS